MLFIGLVGLWMIFYGLPDLVFHRFQWGSYQGVRDESQVALTFDDGPGPDTPSILRELDRLGVRATFFVVAEQAQNDPGLIKQMVDLGHDIGVHGYRHVSAFLMTPWRSFAEVGRATMAIRRITGQKPRWFRPPWGHFNLGTWLGMKYHGLAPVLWSVAPDDWRPDRSPEQLVHHVVQYTQPGTVIVLHDAGGNRSRTVQALDGIVVGLRAFGIQPVPLGLMRSDPSFARRIWTWWEIRFTRGWDIDTVPNSRGGESVLRLGLISYHGRPLTLEDGTVMSAGHPMGEIHFGNPALSQMSKSAVGGLRAFHAVLRGLSDLAGMIEENPKYRDIRAVGGITLLDAHSAIEKLGFIRVPVYGWKRWSMWIYLTLLMAMYHQSGWKTWKRFRRLNPVLLIMSKNTLLSRYGSHRKSSLPKM